MQSSNRSDISTRELFRQRARLQARNAISRQLNFAILAMTFLTLISPAHSNAHTLPEAGRVTEIVLVPRPSPRPVAPTQRRPPLDRLGTMPYDSIVEVPESVLREPTELRTDAGYNGRFVEDVRVIDIPDFQFPRRDLWQKPATIQRLNSRYLYLSADDLVPAEGQASRPGYVRMRVRQQSRIYQSEFRTRPLYTAEDAVRAVEQGRRVVEAQATPCPSPTAAPFPTPVPRPTDTELRSPSPAPSAPPSGPDRPAGTRAETEAELQRAQNLNDIQPRSDRERRLLEAIRRSGARIPLMAVKRMIFFMRHPPPGGNPANQRYITIADLSANSSRPRNHIIDLQNMSIQTVAVAHGRGARGENTHERARVFSNRHGSNLSPIGFMVATGPHRNWERNKGTPALTLRGLQRGVNDQNESRGIIIHAASYVSDARARAGQPQGRTQGCLGYDPRTARWVRQNLQQSLVMIYGGIERSIDYSRDRY